MMSTASLQRSPLSAHCASTEDAATLSRHVCSSCAQDSDGDACCVVSVAAWRRNDLRDGGNGVDGASDGDEESVQKRSALQRGRWKEDTQQRAKNRKHLAGSVGDNDLSRLPRRKTSLFIKQEETNNSFGVRLFHAPHFFTRLSIHIQQEKSLKSINTFSLPLLFLQLLLFTSLLLQPVTAAHDRAQQQNRIQPPFQQSSYSRSPFQSWVIDDLHSSDDQNLTTSSEFQFPDLVLPTGRLFQYQIPPEAFQEMETIMYYQVSN